MMHELACVFVCVVVFNYFDGYSFDENMIE